MSSDDSGGSLGDKHLNEIIAEYLQAVELGNAPDRDELIGQHPDLADDLKSFFANHDKMRELADPPEPVAQAEERSEAPTIPPRALDSEAATIPPSRPSSETATIPPTPGFQGAVEEATAPPRDLDTSGPDSDQAAPPVGTKVRYFGDCELLEEIARGGWVWCTRRGK
jgi:hypothetical protein